MFPRSARGDTPSLLLALLIMRTVLWKYRTVHTEKLFYDVLRRILCRKSVLAAVKIQDKLCSQAVPSYSYEDACGRAFMAANIINGLGSINQVTVSSSVADPDPKGPYVFVPPGSASGSISQRYRSGSESFYHHVKIVRKTLIPTVL